MRSRRRWQNQSELANTRSRRGLSADYHLTPESAPPLMRMFTAAISLIDEILGIGIIQLGTTIT
jgi:hypothetical protein